MRRLRNVSLVRDLHPCLAMTKTTKSRRKFVLLYLTLGLPLLIVGGISLANFPTFMNLAAGNDRNVWLCFAGLFIVASLGCFLQLVWPSSPVRWLLTVALFAAFVVLVPGFLFIRRDGYMLFFPVIATASLFGVVFAAWMEVRSS